MVRVSWPVLEFCTPCNFSATANARDFKFGTLTYHSKSHPAEEKSSLKGAWSGLGEPFIHRVISPPRLMLETSNFVHWSAMHSLSLVMSECFVSGRGQVCVSNFYIVDLENFATASRRYTGVISTTRPWSVCLWHLQDNESDSVASWLSAHIYYTLSHCNPSTT